MGEAREAAGGSEAARRAQSSGSSGASRGAETARRVESVGPRGAARAAEAVRRVEPIGERGPRLDVERVAERVAVRLGAAAPALRRRSRWLADQIERACGSMLLNLGEQEHVAGGNRRLRLETAAGSAAEVRRALRFGLAFGHVDANLAEDVDADLDRVIAMLWKLRHR